MRALEQVLVDFFTQVAQQDNALLEKLKQEQNFSVDQGHWYFTLPALYRFLQHQYDVFNDIDYQQFRQLIFNSPVNQTIKLYAAEITIINNHAKVDESRYGLVWQSDK